MSEQPAAPASPARISPLGADPHLRVPVETLEWI